MFGFVVISSARILFLILDRTLTIDHQVRSSNITGNYVYTWQ